LVSQAKRDNAARPADAAKNGSKGRRIAGFSAREGLNSAGIGR
jgi:hypothetical protein